MSEISETGEFAEGLDALCANLEQELERQETVLSLTRAQGEAAKAHELDALEARTRALIVLMEDSFLAEKDRHAILEGLLPILPQDRDKQTLSELIRLSADPWSRRLGEFQVRLKEVLVGTQAVVRENAVYMRRALRVLNSTFRAFNGTDGAPRGGYDAEGLEPSEVPNFQSMLDAQG